MKADGCWEWTGSLTKLGYGQISGDDDRDDRGRGKNLLTHRVAYELQNGPIPEGMLVRHLCNNRKCVRGSHLSVGSMQDNKNDQIRFGVPPPSGEKHGLAKLSESDVAAIRRKYAEGRVSQRAIGAEYGISQRQVGRIVRHLSWR